MPDGRRKEYVKNCLELVKDDFEILPFNQFSADIWGKAMGSFEKEGFPLPICDTQIAATAISNGMILVTHNTEDFKPLADRCFLEIEDWFEG